MNILRDRRIFCNFKNHIPWIDFQGLLSYQNNNPGFLISKSSHKKTENATFNSLCSLWNNIKLLESLRARGL